MDRFATDRRLAAGAYARTSFLAAVSRGLLASLLILLVIAPVSAQETGELRAVLDQTAYRLVEAHRDARLLEEARLHHHSVDLRFTSAGEVVAGVIIRVRDGAHAEALQRAGMRVQTVAGDIVAGTVPADRLAELAGLPEVQFVEVAPMLELMNDLGGVAIGVPDLHGGVDLPHPFRGEGVIVGVLDTGIDITHPDFFDSDGTRIEYLLDFLPDDGNHPPTAQAEWTRDQINDDPDSVTQLDVNGHGTHVAGTAGGGGKGDPAFVGAAPESRLVIVNGPRQGGDPDRPTSFSGVDMINAVDYVFQRAVEMDMPAVINISFGSLTGAQDGTDHTAAAISNLTGPGRIVVFANGNNGHQRVHAGTEIEPGATATIAFNYSTADTAYEHPNHGPWFSFRSWYTPGSVASVSLAARDPDTYGIIAEHTVPVGQADADWFELTDADDRLIAHVQLNALTTSSPQNGHGQFFVAVTSRNDEDIDLADHLWTVTVTGGSQAGQVDLWLNFVLMGNLLTEAAGIPDLVPADMRLTVNFLATGHEVIGAGSFTTRNQWQNAGGETVSSNFQGEPAPLDRRSWFSSRGPTRDGRVRPDIVAPGSQIASSLTSSRPNYGNSLFGAPAYTVIQGTSMASPFVAGTIALMLQANPALTPGEVRDILLETAVVDAEMGVVPNDNYGYGRLDAFAAVRAALGDVSTEPGGGGLAVLGLEAPYPNPARGAATVVLQLPQSDMVTLSVYDLLGREVRRLVDDRLAAGPHQMRLERHGLASGVYLVALRAGTERRTQKLVLID